MKSVKINGADYKSAKEVCRVLGISYDSVMSYRRDTGASMQASVEHCLKSEAPAPKWTGEEIALVEDLAEKGLSQGEIARALGRSQKAVNRVCSDVKIPTHGQHRLTEEERRRIMEASDADLGKIASEIGCDMNTVYYHRKKGGKYGGQVRYEPEIRSMAGEYTAREIAERLGLTERRVRNVATRCNISLATPRSGRREWTEAELNYLRQNYETKSLKQMGKELDRRPTVVSRKLRLLGLY